MYDDGQSTQVEFLRRQCEQVINDDTIDVSTREDHCKDILTYVAGFANRSHFDMRYYVMDHHPNYTYNDMFLGATQLTQLKLDLNIDKKHDFDKSSSEVNDALLTRLEDTAWLYTELL